MKNINNYWQDKISLWLHDPVCKVFDIPHHEEIADEIAKLLYQTSPEKEIYKAADMIASSLARTQLPAYKDGGGIDFNTSSSARIAHPLVKKDIVVELPKVDIANIKADIKKLLTEDLGLDKDYSDLQSLPEKQRPLNGFFDRSKTPEDWAKALFNYLFFAFKKRLRIKNIGNLGCIWDILPADTRMPDHPLWHHLGMVSAIGSCLQEDKDISIVAYSITPVQDFIAKARKLRDYWSGSVLLSYLSFTGITSVMNTLGPDHILYPSLHNQTMVNTWLEENFHLGEFVKESDEVLKTLINDTKGIAAMPNKFVFICSSNMVTSICNKISETVLAEWKKQAEVVKKYLMHITDTASVFFDNLWNTQIEDFWKLSWSSTKLADLNDKEILESLLPDKVLRHEFNILSKIQTSNTRLYSSSHSLVQSLLAAGKTKPTAIRRAQFGEKCPLCGEREVLHNFEYTRMTSANDYKNAIGDFWNKVREHTNTSDSYAQTGKTERLCAVCAVKRYLPVELKKKNDRTVLGEIFVSLDKNGFPSTTEIAVNDYLLALESKGISFNKDKLIDEIHLYETEPNDIFNETSFFNIKKQGEQFGVQFSDNDKYYALLLMDGDKMGDLINGETITATYQDIIHPELANKIKNGVIKANLKNIFNERRLINPAIHAMISDSLNNFARFGVQPIVKYTNGRLIYAGGDDVCAILPVSQALECAYKIQKSYRLSFAQYNENGAEPIDSISPSMTLLGYHLGEGADKISLSGAIVIAHHKQPLREVIKEAHTVLDSVAKEKLGRNAIAIRLHKRSGGYRDWGCKWDSESFTSFNTIVKAAYNDKISSGLLYKIQTLETAFYPFMNCTIDENKEKQIESLLKYELNHSGIKISDVDINTYAKSLKNIILNKSKENIYTDFTPEAAIIASFLGKKGDSK